MILGYPWVKKDEVLFYMINSFIPYFLGYCLHLKASLILVPTMPTAGIISIAI